MRDDVDIYAHQPGFHTLRPGHGAVLQKHLDEADGSGPPHVTSGPGDSHVRCRYRGFHVPGRGSGLRPPGLHGRSVLLGISEEEGRI